jgi:hypothetical protein
MEDMIKKRWKKRDMYYRSPGAKLPANIIVGITYLEN